jgi:putative PEP-CTERM system histidine kinase
MIAAASALPAHWALLGGMMQSAAALGAGLAAIWIASRRQRFGEAGTAIVASLALTGLWCLSLVALPDGEMRQGLPEAIGKLGWLLVLYRLFSGDGRHASFSPIKPVIVALAFVELIVLAMQLILPGLAVGPLGEAMVLRATVILQLLVGTGALVMLHNLYAGASAQARTMLRWPALGLAVFWGFDLNLQAVAYLSPSWPAELAALRGISIVALAILLTCGAARGSNQLRFSPSRKVAFQSFSLLVIGGYLAAMFAVAQWLSFAGGDLARLMQFGFVTAATVAAAALLPSRRLRGWMRVMLAKHFFRHRYDYREEWLRFTRTMGMPGGGASADGHAAPLEERAIQALADIADSGSGLLLAPGEHGDMVLAAQWNWPTLDVPASAMPAGAAGYFERTGRIVDLDDVRGGRAEEGEADVVPAWLTEDLRAWAMIPLIHFDRLVGLVVLARAVPARRFDWEDFDLMRVAGRQLASYLAENALQEALTEANRFDDFHRRIAFVMHDIKNLASQLSLLARNAELHADKPEFRADMLVTLRNSADKLNNLLARLSRYVTGSGGDKLGEVNAGDVVRQVAAQFREQYPVLLSEVQDHVVTANRDALEQVLVHLVQNAIDASESGSPVLLGVAADGLHASIEVVDSGCGMTPEFVRTRLFKPFVSSKQGGFGIGAFEARELVRAMRGRLEVESRAGLGTRFAVRLPLAEARDILNSLETARDGAAKKVA